MNHTLAIATVVALGSVFPALAVESPKLPPSAKKLSQIEIVALYDRVPMTYEDYMYEVLTTGAMVLDLNNGTLQGTYSYPGSSGQIIGKVWMKDDQLCAIIEGGRPESCSSILC
jgi:hypothetical protein